MDRLIDRLPVLLVVLGLLAAGSVALAVAEDRTPTRAPVAATVHMELPEGHERMLGIMRVQAHSHHLERMRDDADWQPLRDGSHIGHLEAYQAEIDRMLARPHHLRATAGEASR